MIRRHRNRFGAAQTIKETIALRKELHGLKPVQPGSASQHPCGWLGMRGWKRRRNHAHNGKAPPRFAKPARDCFSTSDAFRATRLAVSRCQQWQRPRQTRVFSVHSRNEGHQYFYCGATGYLGAADMGL